ncbi:Ig-like domain-containing protein [uncultured Methanobrevibacter sp.]|uniref:Ig-like domain-containing protein n=1 Tax=uncultured Methanobrevibacter sp. TaxID=253161 RepID=UPI00261353C5|nr:Ig-like domain-containing protein [uncultured Methanobrevibacter sp.]
MIISISAVSAENNNSDIISINNNDDNAISINNLSNEEILSANTGSFADLNTKINGGSSTSIELDMDYEYSSSDTIKDGIVINRDNLTIDGKGHKIDAKGQSRIFYVNSTTVYLKNIKLVNGNADNGGAFYGNGDNLRVINCTFENNKASSSGGAIYSFPTSLAVFMNSVFKNNVATWGGAITTEYGYRQYVINCTFDSNNAKNYGGAVFIYGKQATTERPFSDEVNIRGSTFINNKAETGDAISNFISAKINITDSVLLGNVSNLIDNDVYFAFANNNWFGNTYDNRAVRPNIPKSVEMNNWLYLDLVPDLGTSNAVVSINNLFDSNTGETSTYTTSNLPSIAVNVNADNSVIDIDKVILDHSGEGKFNFTFLNDTIFTASYQNSAVSKKVKGGSFAELQALINAANDGDVITLDKDYVYIKNLDKMSQGIQILDKHHLIIDGNGHTVNADGMTRVFAVDKESNDITFKNINIANGYLYSEEGGAGMHLASDNSQLVNCTFTNNVANTLSGGAALAVHASHFTISGCRFVDNTQLYTSAGALFLRGNDLTVRDTLFENNYAIGFAGALESYDDCDIINCTFRNNSANYAGATFNYAHANFIDCTFTGNRALKDNDPDGYVSGAAGAIYAMNTTISNCVFTYNDASMGAAIFIANNGTDIDRCIFINNTGGYNGVICSYAKIAKVSNSVFLNNNAGYYEISCLAEGIVADYNWFGNIWYKDRWNQYDTVPPVSNYAKMNNWLFLNVTDFNFDDKGKLETTFTFFEYDNRTKTIIQYDIDDLPEIILQLSSQNLTLNKNVSKIGETIQGSATYHKGALYAEYENVKYEVPFIHRIESKIIVNSTINVFVDSQAYVNYELIPFEYDALPFLESNKRLTITSNDTSIAKIVSKPGGIYVSGVKVGLALLSIKFNGLNVIGEDKYTPANATVLVNVTRIPTHIGFIFDPEDMGIGESGNLYVSAYDYKNKSVYGSGLTYTNNNESVLRLAGNSFRTLSEGLANVTVSFAGNYKYEPCSLDVTFNVAKRTPTITVDTEELELYIGQEYYLGLSVKEISGAFLNCSSNDTSVAVFTDNNAVHAVGRGIANLTIRYDGNEKYKAAEKHVILTVIDFETHIEVDSEKEMNITDTALIRHVLKNSKNETISVPIAQGDQFTTTYISNDTSVVTVDESGYIRAVGVGVANVTIRFNGYVQFQPSSANMIVRVSIPKNDIIVSPEIDLHVGEKLYLNASLEHRPFDFKATDFKYEVNDTDVVRISQYGSLTGFSEGTAKITIRYNASSRYTPSNATVIVKVVKGTTKITSPQSISLLVDETLNLNANLTSLWENKNITGLKYESSDNKVAKVDKYGLITAVGVGQANISVKYDGSNKYYGDSTNVLVTVDYVPTEINVGKTFILFIDQSENLNAILNPADIGSLIYESSNENIVKVDDKGIITGVGVGQANVTVLFNGTKKYANSTQTVLVTIYPLDIPTSISVNGTIVLDVYDSIDMGAVLTPSNAGDLTYESSDESIAKVDSNGIVTGVGVGEAKITVRFMGDDGRFLPSNATTLVKVNKVATEITAKDTISLFIDETEGIGAILNPANAVNLTYASSNSSIVSVDANGMVTGVGIGEAIITVSYVGDSNHISSSKNITVTVDRISTKIDVANTFALIIGETGNLNAVLSPSDAGNLTYECNDSSVVSVGADGTVNALKIGNANVTVSFKGTNKYATSTKTILVSVYSSNIPTSISVNETIELSLHNSTEIGAALTPSNAGNLTYLSSNENIVKVDANGVVSAVGVGEANVTVRFAGIDGKFLASNATVLVKVNKIGTEITSKDSISLIIDETESIDAILNPANAGNLNYVSSDETIVKVDSKGVVTAVGSGNANITVSYVGSNDYIPCSKNITVTVNKISTEIDVGKTFILVIGGTVNVGAALTPIEAGNLTYTSCNESIVKVDSKGVITAVGSGEATVNVRFNGTNKYAQSSENVTIIVKSVEIPTSISVNNKFDLYVGDKIDINTVLDPANAGSLTYVSSNESIVKVDENGLIAAVGVGVANVTIKFDGVKDKFAPSQAVTAIKVSAIPTNITAESPITLNLTENSTIKYDFSHSEAGNVEFIIENPNIVSINNGVITANGVGKTNVTIVFNGNANYTSSKAVVLVNVVDVATTIDASDVTVNVTENAQINAKLTPGVGKLSYESSNSSIVSVDANGVVTGVGVGVANITIKFAAIGKYQASTKTITVNVVDVATTIDAFDVSVNVTQRASIVAKLTPNVGKLSYESSNSSIVSVDANGMVTGVGVGVANVTIRFAGIGKYQASTKTITVNVVDVATTIDASDVSVNVTERANINAILTPNVGKLSYISSNSSIVTVDSYGGIKGILIGEADIFIKFEATGKYRAANKTVHVKVTGVPTKIDVNNTISLFVDDDANLGAVLTPKTLDKLSYSTNDSSIVSVDENGNIKAIKEGTAMITVSYSGNSKYLPSNNTVTVKVSRIPTNITIETFDLELGEGRSIKAILNPIRNSKGLIFSCNDSSIVELDESGFISALTSGKVLVTVKFPGNDKYLPSNASFTITVDARVTTIDVEKDIEIGFNETKELNARVLSKYYETGFPATYESSNPDIVSVDENGKITGNKIGNATITVKFAGANSFYPSNATVNVVVTTRTTHVNVAKSEISLHVDDQSKIEASILDGPNGAKLTYMSSDIRVVSVDSTGKITANNEGTAIITVTYAGDDEYHSSFAKVNVTVTKLATKIVSDNTFETMVFETIDLHAVLTPSEGLLTYTSSDNEIASVDSSGKLTAKTTGNVVVTIKFAGDRKYLASQKQVIVSISKVPTSINATDITIYSGEEFKLQNIVTPSGAPSTSKYLKFDSGDLEVFDVDANGLITTYQEGIADLYIEFKGNDAYLPSNATIIVNVIKRTLTSDECTFTVDVSDDAGEATFTLNVPEDATGNFIVTVDGEPFGDEDNIIDGVGVVNVDGLAPGNHKVTMRYTGDEKYFSVNNQTTIHIYRIKIDKNKDVSVVYSERAVYKVHLTSDTQAMENKTVTFKINGKTYYGITDMYGYASVKLPKLPIKTYTITASYKGIKVTNKIVSKHIVVAKNINAKKTKALKVKVTLNKVNKKYLAKKKVTLKFKGRTYTAKTNSKGVVTFTISKGVLAGLKVGKSYTYKVTYSKDTVSKKIKIVK